jgi:hypothetical protein
MLCLPVGGFRPHRRHAIFSKTLARNSTAMLPGCGPRLSRWPTSSGSIPSGASWKGHGRRAGGVSHAAYRSHAGSAVVRRVTASRMGRMRRLQRGGLPYTRTRGRGDGQRAGARNWVSATRLREAPVGQHRRISGNGVSQEEYLPPKERRTLTRQSILRVPRNLPAIMRRGACLRRFSTLRRISVGAGCA